MARRLRSNRADGWYHVFHRGIERRDVFLDERDREHFCDLLGERHGRYRVVIHAFSLMDNHGHGVVQTPEANLSAAMQGLHLSHAAWFNARHQRVGPLWQGRFRRETSGKRELRRRVRFGEIARAVEPVMGGVCRELFGRRGGPGKALAMWAARRYGGLTLRETGEALGGLDYAAVSIALKRLERKAAANRDVRTQMARICALLKVET